MYTLNKYYLKLPCPFLHYITNPPGLPIEQKYTTDRLFAQFKRHILNRKLAKNLSDVIQVIVSSIVGIL